MIFAPSSRLILVMCQVLKLQKKKSSYEEIKTRRSKTMSACEIPEDQVKIGDFIAEGGQGQVYKGTYAGQKVAIKTVMLEGSLSKREKITKAFKLEIDITVRLKHPNIAQTFGVLTGDVDSLKMVMEYAPNGSLRELLDENPDEPLPSKTQMSFITQLCHGLGYLHGMNVAHKDMKSLNVLRFALLFLPAHSCYSLHLNAT
jgi:serine/threonine protein kinase